MMGSSDLVKYAACAACGMVFGIAAEKGRVHEPGLIRGQMDFSYYTMMKMFLGAAASGMALMSAMTMFSSSGKRRFIDARCTYLSCLRNKGYVTAMLGGGLLGCGMTLAGSCPGMVLVQVGSFTHNALYTFGGGMIGVLVYSILEPALVALTRPSGFSSHDTLDGKGSYASTALPLAAIIGCAVAGLEYVRHWTADVSGGWSGGPPLQAHSWPPYVAGAMIGALQPLLIWFVGDTLGNASSYCTILSQVLVTDRLRRAFPYLSQFRTGLANWWRVFFISGAVGGAYLSAASSGNLAMSSPVTQTQALLGGALMLFGSRLASGCTSGHGLSGVGLLVMNSFATVVFMFAGAMGTYAAMKQGMINL